MNPDNPYASPVTTPDQLSRSAISGLLLRRRLIAANLFLVIASIAVGELLESTLPPPLLAFRQAEANRPLSPALLAGTLAALVYILGWLFSLWALWSDKRYSLHLFASIVALGVLAELSFGPSVSTAAGSALGTCTSIVEGALLLQILTSRPGLRTEGA